MAGYFGHWLRIGREADATKRPMIFLVNWFRKDEDGDFLWPGFGENSRVLEWVFRRCNGEGRTEETPMGRVPAQGELNVEGLNVSKEAVEELLSVDTEALREQLPQVREHLETYGGRLPDEIRSQLEALETRLANSPRSA
jgi:phosphoenolpyruvate carboxykinase (GTP)